MAAQKVESMPFHGLSASVDPALIPPGHFAAMDGASVERSSLETGPRWGDVWSRPGAAVGDVGRGLYLGQYGLLAEYVAIVRANGEATCRAYSITPAGVWTLLKTGLPDKQWTFRQYEDRVYACAQGAGIWVHTLGWTAATDVDAGNILFDPFLPVYSGVIGAISLDTNRPVYPTHPWSAPDTLVYFDTSYGALGTGTPRPNDYRTKAVLNSAGGEITVSTTASTSQLRTLVCTVVITLGTTQDWTGMDFAQYLLTASRGTPTTGTQGGLDPIPTDGTTTTNPASIIVDPPPASSGIFEQYFALSSDGATTPTQAWADLQPRARLSIYSNDSGSQKAVFCDLRTTALLAVLPTVKRVIFRVAFTFTGDGSVVRVSPLSLGGAAIHDWAPNDSEAPAQDYAVAFRNPTSGALSTATRATLAKPLAGGLPLPPAKRPLGAWVEALEAENATLYGQGFTKVALFRSHTISGVQYWRRVDEANNAGGTVSLIDTVAARDMPSLPASTLDFGEMPAALVADAIGVWKQHFLIASSRLLFGSWGGEPTRYLPPPEDDYDIPEEDDLTQGRTLYVAMDRTEGVIAAVEGDLLYLLGPRTASVMIGDSMLTATPPRRLPGSRGILGLRACCAHDAGALVASPDGLWYYEATRAFTGSSDGTYRQEELTDGIRDAWRRLVGADGTGLSLVSWEDEIWAFNAGRFLRLTRPLAREVRAWEEGAFAPVVATAAAVGLGVRAILSTGKVALLWRDASGDRYDTDAGVAGTWSATTGWIPSNRRQLVGVFIRAEGTPTLVIESLERTRGIKSQTIPINENRLFPASAGRLPGAEHRMTFSGQQGRDRILDVAFVWEDAGGGAGT